MPSLDLLPFFRFQLVLDVEVVETQLTRDVLIKSAEETLGVEGHGAKTIIGYKCLGFSNDVNAVVLLAERGEATVGP